MYYLHISIICYIFAEILVRNVYIQRINTKQNGKVYPSIVLCRSYRENGKQKREILATLTKWPEHIVSALEVMLKGKPIMDLNDLNLTQGKSIGALLMFKHLAQHVGLIDALGPGRNALLALLQIFARCIDPSSRLHISNYWQDHYELHNTLKIDFEFSADHLYKNLDWLADNQSKIEKKLFFHKYPKGKIAQIYLYDVTSSYFEGQKNEMAQYGYNRDKKKGKKQIVIGLLCDNEGDPVSIEVFEGNTSDLSTLSSQLNKLKDQFGVERVVMIGDKGMIKSKQIDQINELSWHYITSITKQQIKKMLDQGVIQMSLFESEPIEVEVDNVRYILRKNNLRSEQIAINRAEKIASLKKLIGIKNEYLSAHPKAKEETAITHINTRISRLKLSDVAQVEVNQRVIELKINEEALSEASLLDGCYVIRTDLKQEQAPAKEVHDRYKDLAMVENAFRTIKTGLEEIRPIYVRKKKRTKGHVFICMLAYKLIHRLKKELRNIEDMPTTKEIIKSMESIHTFEYDFEGHTIKTLPKKFLPLQQKIISTLNIKIPSKLYAK